MANLEMMRWLGLLNMKEEKSKQKMRNKRGEIWGPHGDVPVKLSNKKLTIWDLFFGRKYKVIAKAVKVDDHEGKKEMRQMNGERRWERRAMKQTSLDKNISTAATAHNHIQCWTLYILSICILQRIRNHYRRENRRKNSNFKVCLIPIFQWCLFHTTDKIQRAISIF